MRTMIVLAIAIAAGFPAVTAAQQPVPLGTPVDSVRPRRPMPPSRAMPPVRGRVVAPAQGASRPAPVRAPQGARPPQARVQVPQGARAPQAARAAEVMTQRQRELRLNAVRGAQVARRMQVGQQRLQAAQRVQGVQRMQPQQRMREQGMSLDRLSTMRERLNLSDDQVKRMREIEEHAMKERIEATSKQRAEMQREMERTREHRQKLVEEMRKDQEATRKKLLEVLTAEQRRQLEQGRANGVRPDRVQR